LQVVSLHETAHGWRLMGFVVQFCKVWKFESKNCQEVTYWVKCWTMSIPTTSTFCWLQCIWVVRFPYPYNGTWEWFGLILRATLIPSWPSKLLYPYSSGVWLLHQGRSFENEMLSIAVYDCESCRESIVWVFCHNLQCKAEDRWYTLIDPTYTNIRSVVWVLWSMTTSKPGSNIEKVVSLSLTKLE